MKRTSVACVAIALSAVAAWQLHGPGHAAIAGVTEPLVAHPDPVPAFAVASTASPISTVASEVSLATGRVDEMIQRGALRDTDLDGDWGIWLGDRLRPSLMLRRRFDYLLTGRGEVRAGDLRQWIELKVAAEHGRDGAAQVLAVWDNYLKYIEARSPEGTAAVKVDAASLQRELDRRIAAQQAALGNEWARVFFAEENATLATFIAQRLAQSAGSGGAEADGQRGVTQDDVESLILPPATNLSADQAAMRDARRVAELGPEAAMRLRTQDTAWDDWQQRLEASRQRLAAIAQDPQLSEPQRAEAQQRELTEHFSGSELTRARALFSPTP